MKFHYRLLSFIIVVSGLSYSFNLLIQSEVKGKPLYAFSVHEMGTQGVNQKNNHSVPNSYKTINEIEQEYIPKFENLRIQTIKNVEQLIKNAKEEIKRNQSYNENTSFLYLYNKYKNNADTLESKTDKTFNELYIAMMKELTYNGHPPEIAYRIKTTYQIEKVKQKKEIIKLVLNLF
ncbi:hypothetical protein GH741_08660 [Aquibacillus halophilus]|uniref:Uncharacterized protein n=1 Tax=Aquibacillus halophilus TaxID=930132 RepID=A0A6A8DAW0_9BACI|nr:hypothetical protein [Aquibacillus halophilus]MRH42758.1 hypothetical protein [Aquibacillus halophilus]